MKSCNKYTIFVLIFVLLSLVLTETRKKKIKAKTNDFREVIKGPYQQSYGKEFIPLASFSYCSLTQMKTDECCSNSLPLDFKVEMAEQVSQDNYTFAVLKNDVRKQIVISLTGTKQYQQLAKQGYNSNLVSFGDPKYKMNILSYFNTIYTQVKEKLKPKLLQLKSKHPTYQYIFTGHSLGGAMSTIFALDSALEGYVNVNYNSPALINYASPRVGNYVFASYVMKHVPVIYRIVRQGDPVVSVPPCSTSLFSIFSKCKNKLGYSGFKNNEKVFNYQTVPDDNGYWHIGGLINYTNDMSSFTDCGKEFSENHPNSKCNLNPKLSVTDHTSYLDQQVSGVCQGARRYLLSKRVLKQFKRKTMK
jgi:hypothetical protein